MRFVAISLVLLGCTAPVPPVVQPTAAPVVVAPPVDPDLPLVKLDPAIRSGKLANGLAYFVAKETSDLGAQYTRVALVIDAGVADETPAQRGATVQLGHAFRPIVGGDIYEDSEVTTVRPTSTLLEKYVTEAPDSGLEKLRDAADGVNFDEEIVDLSALEYEMKRAPRPTDRVRDKRRFDPHSQDHVKAYYRTWYRADRMSVIVVGEVDVDKTVQAIEAQFGSLAKPKSPMPVRTASAKTPAPARALQVEADANETKLAQRFVHHRARGEAGYRAMLADRFVLDQIEQRVERLTERDVAITTEPLGADQDLVTFTLDSIERDDLELLVREIERLRVHGVDELELAAWNAIGPHPRTEAAIYSGLVEHALGERGFPSRDDEKRLMAALTLDEVNAACHALETERGRTIYADVGADEVREIDDRVRAAKLPAWSEIPENQPLVSPTPGTIVSTTSLDGLTTYQLGNGARVIVRSLPSAEDNPTIYMAAIGRSGWVDVPPAESLVTSMAGSIATWGGLGPFTMDRWKEAMRGRSIGVAGFLGRQAHYVRMYGDAKRVETMMQAMHLALAKPTRDPDAFAKWKAGFNFSSNTERAFHDLAMRLDYLEGDYSEPFITKPEIEALDLDRVLAIYADHYGNIAGTTFVMIGPVDLALLPRFIETYLASIVPFGNRIAIPAKPRPVPKATWPARSTVIGASLEPFVIADYIGETVPGDVDAIVADLFDLGTLVSIKLGSSYPTIDAGVSAARRKYMRVRLTSRGTEKDIQAAIDAIANEEIDAKSLDLLAARANLREHWIDEMFWGIARGEDPVKLATFMQRRFAHPPASDAIRAQAKRFTKPTVIVTGAPQ